METDVAAGTRKPICIEHQSAGHGVCKLQIEGLWRNAMGFRAER
jgi:hypothetical protein